MSKKKIVIITTAQPSTNPRMVKEYLALKQAGYQVTVLYSYAVPWALAADKQLFKEYGLDENDFILVGGSPEKNKLSYLSTRISKKLADKYFKNSKRAISRTCYHLYKKALAYPADLYIGHTLGALPAAVHAAKKHRSKAGFDAEDFHRGEMTMGKFLFDKNAQIESRYFPNLDYFIAASPMVTDQYRKLFPAIPGICINNFFSLRFLNDTLHKRGEGQLKLWWFSQKIGRGRGLEDVIKAVGLIKNKNISLDLLGNITDEMKTYLRDLADQSGMMQDQLHFSLPLPENELFHKARQFDIGLALETGLSDNLKFCLANKIFTYLLAGNAIIFSDTPAQKAFWEEHPGCGSLYERENLEQLAAIIKAYLENRSLLQTQQEQSLKLSAEKLNWELESAKLVNWVGKFI